MTLIDLIMAAEAAQAGVAVRRTAYRHVHVAQRPLVVVAYNLSGEAAAPLGFMYGTDNDPANASLAVAAEPRNRDSRFGAINQFAADFVDFVRPHLVLQTVPTRKPGVFRQVASNAPQIVVPNRATRAYLGPRLGRSLRYLGLGDTFEVPEATQWTGAHLSWYAEHSNLPGQSAILAMTEALSSHFVTGQSALEDENLATLLAWIAGVPDDALAALEVIENEAYGPVPTPEWEVELEPWVKQYTEGLRAADAAVTQEAFDHVAGEVREKLSAAYEATHRAIGVLRTIEPATSVPDRWETDVREWSAHARRCASGIPRFARRHDPLRAARSLQKWTKASDDYETQKAFDDPLIMAGLDASGRCVTGVVETIDRHNKEIKPGGKRQSAVPLVHLSMTAPTRMLAEEIVRWAGDKRVRGELRGLDGADVTIAIIGGPGAFGDSGMTAGDEVLFAGLDPWEGPNPDAPDEVPWTHRERVLESDEHSTSALAGDTTDDPTAGADDGSPDMTVAELADVAVVGAVGPDAEPGVVL